LFSYLILLLFSKVNFTSVQQNEKCSLLPRDCFWEYQVIP